MAREDWSPDQPGGPATRHVLDPDLVKGIKKEAAMARLFYWELLTGHPGDVIPNPEHAAQIAAAWIGASVLPEYVLGPEVPDDPLGL
jgi:hypothetical protein